MKNLKKGFTIIEMVIVIAIIGILASVLIPTYGNVVNSAHVSAAQQTARASMMDWLATFTANAKAVPQTYDDTNGNKVYYAYFEVEEGGHLYQYRYNNGGIERTDDKAADYKNFASMDSVKTAYLTTGAAAASNKVEFYRMPGQNSSYIYYMKYTHGADNGFGSADVYAVVPENQTYYTEVDAANSVKIQNATWTPSTSSAAATYTVTYALATAHGLTGSPTVPDASTGNESGAKITLPAQIGTENVTWYTDAAAEHAVTLDADSKYEVTDNVTLYAKKTTA